MPKKLSGHRAVITGASSGLGDEFARQLAAQGADLLIAARREDRLVALSKELEAQHGVKVEVVRSDLAVAGAATKLYQKAVETGPVTMLINNAGIGPYALFLDEPLERHVGTVQLNVVALTELTHLFAGHMREHGKPSYIVNVASIAAFQGAPNFAVYSATKHYVRVFSEVLARELERTNIAVSCLCPGGTLTEFSATNGQEVKSEAMMMTAQEVVRIGVAGMLARRSVVIPGFLNKFAAFAPRFLPSGFALTLAARAMESNVSKK